MKKKPGLFEKRFRLVIESDLNNIDLAGDIADNLDSTPQEGNDLETDAMERSLDPDVTPEDYLTDPAADRALQQQIDQRNKEVAAAISGWAKKLDEFTDYLNSPEQDSLQSILATAQPGTLMAKVQASASRKIANCAQELASLSETFKSFVGQKVITQK